MTALKKTYRVFRSIVFGLLLLIAGGYLFLYVALSLPPVQRWIKGFAEKEFNSRSSGRLEIGGVDISPFSEAVLTDVRFISPEGETVVKASKIGAGINLWRLIAEGKIQITYAEISGLDARIVRKKPDASLNIQFIIDAFKSKKKNQPPPKFDIVLNNVVIRKGHVTFDKEWTERKTPGTFDVNHMEFIDIAADMRMPRLKPDDFIADLRRLSFKERSGLDVHSLSGRFHITSKEISFNDLRLRLPYSELRPSDMTLRFNGYGDIVHQLKAGSMKLHLFPGCTVTPSDFSAFVPALRHYTQTYDISLDLFKRANDLRINELSLESASGLNLNVRGLATSIFNPSDKSFSIEFPALSLNVSGEETSRIIADFSPLKPEINDIIRRLGDIRLDAAVSFGRSGADIDGHIATSAGEFSLAGTITGLDKPRKELSIDASTPGFDVRRIFPSPSQPLDNVQFTASAEGSFSSVKDFDGRLSLDAPLIVLEGESYSNLTVDVEKSGTLYSGDAAIHDLGLSFDISGSGLLKGASSEFTLDADIQSLDFNRLRIKGMPPASFTGFVTARLKGNSPDNMQGSLEAYDINYTDPKRSLHLDNLSILSSRSALPYSLSIDCDWFSGHITGDYRLTSLPHAFFHLLHTPLPDLVPARYAPTSHAREVADISLTVYKDASILKSLKLPVTLLQDLVINGTIDTDNATASLSLDLPYLQQGKDKLIRDSYIRFDIDNPSETCNLSLGTKIPGKKGPVSLQLEANAADNRITSDLAWLFDRQKSYKGTLSLTTTFDRTEHGTPKIVMDVNPSTFEVSDTVWNIGAGRLTYTPKRLEISNAEVSRPGQYATISGVTSDNPSDILSVSLKEINLDYIFETLNINYVVFGGDATGDISVAELFSRHPRIFTENLMVKGLSYNNAVLGDGKLRSWWNPDDKTIHILADIAEAGKRVANVDGTLWIARDSLSFGFDADGLDVRFLKPFMSAFCDDITGHATGRADLYGTFKDINLTGKVYADNVKMRIGVTNTVYSASDTIVLTPGKIHLDNITLHDRDGHTAKLNGYVTHEYFHNPTFKFSITDARNFLVYDTDAKINPVWYGTIYADGSGTIRGVPGFIDVLVDMTTRKNSVFTFVLSDSEEAVDYQFLTFTDRRKEAEEIRIKEQLKTAPSEEPDFVKEFNRRHDEAAQERPTRYRMDLRITATPDAQAIIVMDPAAGDRIRAYGDGSLRFTYNSEGEMGLFGTYTIDRGNYNFTLQELIVRDFKIRQGSKIRFSGDPLAATLDITAAYRVNASLTDLDKSFADDLDVNRNTVPVEALLRVSGAMQSPDIDFDIDLPTMNADVARKVKSIVSTSDMMNMQIVYLLALNRFYTPDYMNSGGSGNEMASLASATLSTQLSNILGQISDNWSIAPSFRTDKGDFSDMEMDLALSSTLLNNRLIFNGNLGYRDKATSSTSFIGDFDIEYLLNPKGTLRLKAYNHYNDQNYYLRSALTTQGLGIVYKRDFNHFLPGLFRRRKKTETDSIGGGTPSPAVNDSVK